MLRVFISHSSKNKPLARRLHRRLGHVGIDSFLDENNLHLGDDLPRRFRTEISRSTHLLVIWTDEAAASPWVHKEIQFARNHWWRRPLIVPLLFSTPNPNDFVYNIKGVRFSNALEFERGFLQLLDFLPGATTLNLNSIRSDFEALKNRDSRLSRLFDFSELADRNINNIPSFGVNDNYINDFPTPNTSDWHDYDFGIWCSVQANDLLALTKWDLPKITLINRLTTLFLSRGIGFEAILKLAARPGEGALILGSLIGKGQSHCAFLREAITIAESSHDPVREWLGAFSMTYHEQLEDQDLQRLLRLLEKWGDGPAPGPPIDLIFEFLTRPSLRVAGLGKLSHWLDSGLFDAASGSSEFCEQPSLYWGLASRCCRNNLGDVAQEIVQSGAARVRKLFRSADTNSVRKAVKWVVDSDRLMRGAFPHIRLVEKAIAEGVLSAEFERWHQAPNFARIIYPEVMRTFARLEHDSMDSTPFVELKLRITEMQSLVGVELLIS